MTKKTTTAQKHGQNRLKAKNKAKRVAGLKLKKGSKSQEEEGSPKARR